MSPTPDKEHRYRVFTDAGTQWLTEAEKDRLMDAVFAPLQEAERVPGIGTATRCPECGNYTDRKRCTKCGHDLS